jgi:predicted amidohydrolase
VSLRLAGSGPRDRGRLLSAFVLALTLGVGAAAQVAAPPKSASAILFTNAWLIDGTGAPAVDHAWVRIDGDRITSTGRSAPPPAGAAQVVDLNGRTIIPGLNDMHAHLGSATEARYMLKMMLAHGITRMKDTGNSLGNLAAIRRWLATDPVTPHVYMSGFIMQGDLENMRFLKAGREAQAMLEDNASFGPQFLKVYNWTSSQALKQMGDFARAHNLILTGHVPLGVTSVEGIDLGMQVLEHVRLKPAEALDDPDIIARYPIDLSVTRREGFWAYFDPKGSAIGRTLDAWARRKDTFFVDPTIVAQWGISHADGTAEQMLGPDVIKLVSQSLLQRWKATGSGRRGETDNPLTKAEFDEGKRATEGWVAFVGLAHTRRIRILTGTDSPVNWVVPGHSLHQELEFFVQAGMKPEEAIFCSTGRAAEAYRTPDRGTIAAGNAADLAIVQGNVADDIRNVERVEKIVLNGSLLDSATLKEQAIHLGLDRAPTAVQ